MAGTGKAVLGTIEIDSAYSRQRALELAVETRNAPESTESILKRAESFAAFIEGKTDSTK